MNKIKNRFYELKQFFKGRGWVNTLQLMSFELQSGTEKTQGSLNVPKVFSPVVSLFCCEIVTVLSFFSVVSRRKRRRKHKKEANIGKQSTGTERRGVIRSHSWGKENRKHTNKKKESTSPQSQTPSQYYCF